MAITLNHTIVPARDKEAAARFFAHIFGLTYDGPLGHFAPVRINETLTLDSDNASSFEVIITPFTWAMRSSTLFCGGCRKPASPTGVTPGIWIMANRTPGTAAEASISATRTAMCSNC